MNRNFPALLLLTTATCLLADEGMWLVNQFPKQAVEEKYGFKVTDDFLEHVRLSSARFNNGGSGSFISPNGLLFTNHHVGADCIQKISSAAHDYMGQGFYAPTLDQEKKCPDLEVNVLLKIEDVTARVKNSAKPDVSSAEANKERKAAMSKIEKECSISTGNRCDVVTLYSGGRYDLYQYKKYTDLRLVFAPEADIAAFGGDPDNFTYPRYCLDFAMFRAYEHDRPAVVAHYFTWSKAGVKEGELSFVPGNPGTTGRLSAVAQLEFSRNYSYPLAHRGLEARVQKIREYSAENAENKRAARDTLLYAENSLKAYSGFLAGLRDNRLMKTKEDEEKALRAAVQSDPKMREKFGGIWNEVAAAMEEYKQFYKHYTLLEYPAPGSELFSIAWNIIRLAEEKQKPNEKRLREYRDSALASLEQSLYSPAPITDSLEIVLLTSYFKRLQDELGGEDPTVKKVLAGKTPEQAAAIYVNSSKLKDVAERKRLASDTGAVKKSNDGMIRLALLLDEPARKLRTRYEDKVEAVLTQSSSALAQARFAVAGSRIYPDATFTFRIAYGPVKGYRSNGEDIPWRTTMGGLFKRATGAEPFRLPPSWKQAKSALDLGTPFNFVTTADIHGGNSGSPTINTRGELIGIVFDGNLASLPNRFVYTEDTARAVHVASQGIVEALRKVYRADRVLKELGMPMEESR